jgi:protein-S-isoprenylcysteine O-methyltransferase Ste14
LTWLILVALDLPLTIRRARKEEAVLEIAFGDRYRQHKAQTWF